MQERKNHLFYISLRWGTYCLISFLTALAIIVPITRIASTLIILGYCAYTAFSILRLYTQIEKEGRQGKTALLAALAVDGQEIIYILLALLAGLACGLN